MLTCRCRPMPPFWLDQDEVCELPVWIIFVIGHGIQNKCGIIFCVLPFHIHSPDPCFPFRVSSFQLRPFHWWDCLHNDHLNPITCLALDLSKDDPSIYGPQHLDWCIPRYVYVNIVNADLSPSIGKLGHHDFVCFRWALCPWPDSMLSDTVSGCIFSHFRFIGNAVRVCMPAWHIHWISAGVWLIWVLPCSLHR